MTAALFFLFGSLLLLLSLAGIAFGAYIAVDAKSREQGVFFVLWWIPAAAAAVGMLLRDPVTFAVGAVCFVVAGVALAVEQRSSRVRPKGRDGTTGNDAGVAGAGRRTPSMRGAGRGAGSWLAGFSKKAEAWIPEGVKRLLPGKARARRHRRTPR